MYKGSWTEKLARLCARRPWVTVGVWTGVLAIAVFLMATLLGGALTTDVKPTNNPESSQAQTIIDERLGNVDTGEMDEILIVKSSTLTVDDPAFQNKVETIYADLIALGPDVVLGGVNYYMTGQDALVSPDRHTTMISFMMPPDGDEKIDTIYALGDKYVDSNFEIYHTGSASLTADTTELGEKTARTGEMIGIGVALVVLIIVFGAVVAAFLPIILGIVAIIAALGLTALVGQMTDLTFTITNIITMMGLAVGIDYSLFILTRFREERRRGKDKYEAIAVAGATSSRAVFYSGMTVVLALAGLVVFPLSIFLSMGIGAILVVVCAVLASMTLLPALLSLMGDKVNALRIPFVQPKETNHYEKPHGFWAWVARTVTKAPVVSLVVAIGILAAAVVPYFDRDTGMSGISGIPDYLRSKQGYLVLQNEFHIGLDSPAVILVDGDINNETVQTGITTLQAKIATNPVFATSIVVPYADKNMAIIYAQLSGDPMTKVAMDGVTELRNSYIPEAFAGVEANVLVTGSTAGELDFNKTVDQYTPIIFIFVLALSFVILTMAFRSVVISAKAILMNLLSVGAAYGLIVLVFQKGVGHALFGFQRVDVIEAWLPLFLFALLFGLSMDYHVFLLSRVREHYNLKKDNTEAVTFGLSSTGRLITGAALIMVAVFGGFALGDMVMFQQMGFGLAVAVFLDATLVRCLLVPAAMKALGEYNWYLPKWLKWMPNVSLGEQVFETVEPAVQEGPKQIPAPGIVTQTLKRKPIPVPVEDVDFKINRRT